MGIYKKRRRHLATQVRRAQEALIRFDAKTAREDAVLMREDPKSAAMILLFREIYDKCVDQGHSHEQAAKIATTSIAQVEPVFTLRKV